MGLLLTVVCCRGARGRDATIIGKQSFFLSGALVAWCGVLGHDGVGGMIDREQNWLALMEWFVFVWGVSLGYIIAGSRGTHWTC